MFFASYEVHDGEEMFEPVFSDDRRAMDDLRSEVARVQQDYSDCLKEDDMGREELESLELLLRASSDVPYAESRKLAKKGAELLEKVDVKLKTAAADLQRFDGESFAGAVSTGRQSDRLTKAALAVRKAREHLKEVSEF